MNMSPDFLTIDDILFIHAEQIRLFGGDPTTRDPGLLASAWPNLRELSVGSCSTISHLAWLLPIFFTLSAIILL